jgi:hypothetical protein
MGNSTQNSLGTLVKKASKDYAEDYDRLMASRPLRRRLRRLRCRCFLPLCHSKSLSGEIILLQRGDV